LCLNSILSEQILLKRRLSKVIRASSNLKKLSYTRIIDVIKGEVLSNYDIQISNEQFKMIFEDIGQDDF